MLRTASSVFEPKKAYFPETKMLIVRNNRIIYHIFLLLITCFLLVNAASELSTHCPHYDIIRELDYIYMVLTLAFRIVETVIL